MRKLILLFAVSATLLGCKFALKTFKGIKNPKIESYASTKKYLFKNGMDTTRVLYFKNLNTFAFASKKKLLQVPNALFFDKSGSFVDYRKNAKDCNAKVGTFIDDLNFFREAKRYSTKTIRDLEKLVQSSNKNQVLEKTDVTVFITWSKYAGSLNREKAFDWVKLLEQAKRRGINVNYYLLNCDLQESWNLTAEQKKDLGLN